jgi:FkbM family methyltransferase
MSRDGCLWPSHQGSSVSMKCLTKAWPIRPFRFVSAVRRPVSICCYLARSALLWSRVERLRSCVRRLSRLPEASFIKVGANDGVTEDPCSDIILKHASWRGVLIEPVPYCCEELKKNFSDSSRFVVEQVAVGTTRGKTPFYYVDREAIKSLPVLPKWYDQLGSFDKNHILRHFGKAIEPFIVGCSVETVTLADVLERNRIVDLHLLHIDTEGYDYEVLRMLDFGKYLPAVILVEHKHLRNSDRSAMRQLLRANGYTVLDCGGDYFAVNRSAEKRLYGNAPRL